MGNKKIKTYNTDCYYSKQKERPHTQNYFRIRSLLWGGGGGGGTNFGIDVSACGMCLAVWGDS